MGSILLVLSSFIWDNRDPSDLSDLDDIEQAIDNKFLSLSNP